MAKIVNPALFIGLGGTGHKVLLQVKKSLLKNYGEMPPVTDILCFDTDIQELLGTKQELSYTNKNGKFVTDQIGFDKDEVIGISIKNPHKLLKFQHIKSWLSDIIEPKIGPSDAGARQIRQMGRFAIFENYNTQRIKDKINDKIKNLNSQSQLRNTDYQIIGNQPCVHLVFSPCGGTGAGTFIDMIMIIKNIDPSIPVYGWIVMPDFYTAFPMTHSVIKNAYASFVEIDHLMGKDSSTPKKDIKIIWSNYYKKPYEVDYTGNGSPFTLGTARFFENIYLFDNIIESGRSILDIEDVYDRIGRILYLMVSGPGNVMQSTYSNNDDYFWPSSPETNGKRRNYSSMGISQIILDRNYLKQLKINQISKSILNAYCFNGKSINVDELNTFIDANSWREDKGKDMVIDTLMPRNLLKYDLESLVPSKLKKGCNVELKTNVDQFLRQWDDNCKRNCTKNRQTILNSFKIKSQDEVLKYIKEKGGIAHAKQFLIFLTGSFQGMRDEMDTEFSSHSSQKEKLIRDEPAYLETLISDENIFLPIGKEKKIKEASDNYIRNAERIMLENWQMIRKESAKLFYDECLVYLKDKYSQIQNIENLVLEVLSDSERETQFLLNSTKKERDFERHIHQYYKDIFILNESDINIQEAFNKINFADVLTLSKISDVKELIQKYVVSTEAVTSIDNLTVEEILNKLPQDIIKNIVSYLDSSSNVCIDIDSSSFLNNSGRTTMQKFGFICVEDKDNSVFKEEGEVWNHISANGGYSELKTFTTKDPDTITMIKIAGMFPACSIKRIDDYKQQYETSVKNGGFHFSDTYFEKFAMDLIDAPDDEGESFKWFVVGSALDKIKLHKAGIYLEYKGKQMVPLFQGTRGKTNREQCSRYFMKNTEYVDYISNIYDKFYEENGKPALKERFINFYRNITSIDVLGKQFDAMDPKSDEYLSIFEEKRILKEFAMNNGIKPEEFGDE